jgi:hypothetical protein
MTAMIATVLVAGMTVALGMPEGYQAVPGCGGCLVHESCIKSVENGKVVDDSFDMSCDHDVLYANEQLYAMDAHTDGSTTFTQMNSSWTVPALPKSSFSQHTNFFWPGFKAEQPEPRYPVLQPVLQFGQRFGQNDWELQSWFVWAFANPPVAITGPRLSVKAGDHVTSWMNFDEAAQIWTVYGRNDANGQESILKIAKSKVGPTDFKYAMHVFETVMPATNYCGLYPPDNKIEFTSVSANNGASIQWTPRTEKSDCQQKVTTSAKGDDVKFTWVSKAEGVMV